MLYKAIRGFNCEWSAIISIRSPLQPDAIIGWKLQTECGTERKFPSAFWDDPYGAAIHAMESHRCKTCLNSEV